MFDSYTHFIDLHILLSYKIAWAKMRGHCRTFILDPKGTLAQSSCFLESGSHNSKAPWILSVKCLLGDFNKE